MIEMTAITTTEIAAELNCTTRDLRKFLRSDESPIAPVGKGSRYSIEKRQLRTIATRYAKWDEARNAAKTPESDNAPEGDDTPETD